LSSFSIRDEKSNTFHRHSVDAEKTPDVYTAEEVHFLTIVAEQIALAFDNALLFDAAQASQ
jgi:GAF domain-containing protein